MGDLGFSYSTELHLWKRSDVFKLAGGAVYTPANVLVEAFFDLDKILLVGFIYARNLNVGSFVAKGGKESRLVCT